MEDNRCKCWSGKIIAAVVVLFVGMICVIVGISMGLNFKSASKVDALTTG